MMKKELKDNFIAIRSAIATRILNSPLVGSVGYASSPHRLEHLQRLASNEKIDRFSFVDVEFRRAGTDCNFYVRAEPMHRWSDDVYTDGEGNEFYECSLKFEVNYPCHGTAPPAVVLARVNFYQQVAMLAAELEAEFAGETIWKMTRTATEVAEDKARVEAARIERAYKAIVEARGKGLRVGKSAMLSVADMNDLPNGTWKGTVNGKDFEISVQANEVDSSIRVGLIARVA